eukprot:NODE_366_length_1630_cov_208.404444.p1 GENE.NODE_366_length_1630_cov_208.404444~~NODE_366_length_1630_cov_208.404444.p1  ORF type:complete len:354 (+),score=143.26 NODE_366_length_1630_cov_208.404444:100-1161(+)
MKTRADGIATCLRNAGPGVLSAEQLKHIGELAMKRLVESLARSDLSTAQRRKEEDGDDDDDDGMPDEEEEEERALQTSLCEVAGVLMRHHPDIFMSECLPAHLNLVEELLKPAHPKKNRKLAVFIACDFVEHLGPRIAPHWPKFMPVMIEDVTNGVNDMRQPACYGISHAAKQPAFGEVALQVAMSLKQVIVRGRLASQKMTGLTAQETKAATDNALSALMEILTHHTAVLGPNEAELWQVWLGALPCQVDDDEGIRNHKALFELLQREVPQITGEGGANVPAVMLILVSVYNTEMVNKETSKGIAALCLRLGMERLDAIAAGWTAKKRARLMRVVRDAQKEAAQAGAATAAA